MGGFLIMYGNFRKNMKTIKNPILKGFNPDPSICRMGNDYYIATSTFEWFPGVQIYHSKDLINWRFCTRPLDRISLLNLYGIQNSGGIWAPCLSYSDGLFWLVYTNVLTKERPWKDTPNFLTTAKEITGPWSEPVFLNSSGFDPSLFHDDDGKKWLINMLMDERVKAKNRFAGVLIQEYDCKNKKLIGNVKNIWQGTDLGKTEGPHIYKKDGYYYLLAAEGGTGSEHAVSVARSKNILGEYESHPKNPIMTSKGKSGSILQCAGHGSFVETTTGEWYMAHLARRPLQNPEIKIDNDNYTIGKSSILGRETSIQKIVWINGWPELANGKNTALLEIEAPNLPEYKLGVVKTRDDFDNEKIKEDFQTLREPFDESWCSLKEKKGWLRLTGRSPLNSNYFQSLIARRLEHFESEIETCVSFAPDNFQQMAGLIAYHDRCNYHYLRITSDDNGKPVIGIMSAVNNKIYEFDCSDNLDSCSLIYLKMKFYFTKLDCFWSKDNKNWIKMNPTLNATTLGDEMSDFSSYTGVMVGLCCQDISGQKKKAFFDYFDYRGKD
jgi:xylan 1,4-beta-xylosidase